MGKPYSKMKIPKRYYYKPDSKEQWQYLPIVQIVCKLGRNSDKYRVLMLSHSFNEICRYGDMFTAKQENLIEL